MGFASSTTTLGRCSLGFTASAPTFSLSFSVLHLGSISPYCFQRQHGTLERRHLSYHRHQPPDRIARLRAHTEPVLCAHCVELDVLDGLSNAVGRRLGDRVIGANDFERLGVAGGAVRAARGEVSGGGGAGDGARRGAGGRTGRA